MIIKTSLFRQTFVLLFVIAVTHYFASMLYIYWTVWWFDMVLHFSSGLCVGMAGSMVWQFYFDRKISFKKAIIVSLLSAFVVGLLWEIFELNFSITTFADGWAYVTDTSSDLLLDISGGILGGIYAYKVLSKNK